MSMTRQEQLDAVVWNYGVWEGDSDFPFVVFEGDDCHYIADEGPFSRGDVGTMYAFTRAEVEARKAEMQDKPSWDDAPEDARVLVYCPGGKNWIFGSYKDAHPRDDIGVWSGIGSGRWFLVGRQEGEVVGDWRNTLEKRPVAVDQPTPEEDEAFNMLEARNGECISGSPVEWDGEGLPPVGVECEVYNHDFADNAEWERCTIKYVGPFYVIYESCSCIERCANHAQNAVKFRPIKSDREKWIDKALDVEAEMPDGYQPYEFLHALYDAGLGKMPEAD